MKMLGKSSKNSLPNGGLMAMNLMVQDKQCEFSSLLNWLNLLGCPAGSDRFTIVSKLVYFTYFQDLQSIYIGLK